MLAYILQLPKKVLIYVYVNELQSTYVQMHAHKIFSLRSYIAVDSITIVRARYRVKVANIFMDFIRFIFI